jgi:hypothetical protein
MQKITSFKDYFEKKKLSCTNNSIKILESKVVGGGNQQAQMEDLDNHSMTGNNDSMKPLEEQLLLQG